MSTRYLLDTNVLSDLVRWPQGAVARRIAEVGERAVCTSIVVAAELRFGAAKLGSHRLADQLDRILAAIDVLPLEEPADRHYGAIRGYLEKQGMTIGPNDLLIAAQALASDLTLVTANRRELERVPGLRVETWPATDPDAG